MQAFLDMEISQVRFSTAEVELNMLSKFVSRFESAMVPNGKGMFDFTICTIKLKHEKIIELKVIYIYHIQTNKFKLIFIYTRRIKDQRSLFGKRHRQAYVNRLNGLFSSFFSRSC